MIYVYRQRYYRKEESLSELLVIGTRTSRDIYEEETQSAYLDK
jgi:hypothetical protein